MKRILSGIAVSLLTLPAVMAKQPETEQEKFSYTIGVEIAQNIAESLQSQNISVDVEAFTEAFKDILAGQGLKLSVEEMQKIAENFQQQQAARQTAAGEQNLAEGQKFLDENRKKDGVVQTESGLQYKVITKGVGQKPAPGANVKVHYRGTLINGKEFDSSYGRGEPVSLSLQSVIPGWQEVVPLMTVGSKWEIYLPAKLGYGDRSMGPDIAPNSTLIFEIELIDING
ncbi:MAG: FKBP-type peptidyl-prolyl cis-trans isomerase [Gammaproteobacteria bacterium]|jgi:FKBP-type peptidyl-prolyl cis-trans isomerase FklB|nr:MAG: FKBP-type peptidyl-prolyl cis-trans isomerase [Gammaproteobacteria bacterium]